MTYAVIDNVKSVQHSHAGTYILGLLLTVVAPLSAALWALVKFWPISGAVWLAGTMVFWAIVVSTAADEDELLVD